MGEKMINKFLLIILFISNTIFAANNNYNYQFNSVDQQKQFSRITHELRCLVCQNESLADSNAPLAKDLRQKIAMQIKSGSSDKQILNFLINRYGDFILYKPRLMPTTYLLWFSPVIFLLLGMMMWWRITHSKYFMQEQDFTEQEQQRLKQLMNGFKES